VFEVLVQYRSDDTDCQSFDHYLIFATALGPADIYNEAVDVLYQFYSGSLKNYTFDRGRKKVCDPTTYRIEIGPTLGT
jgi:hypothetical protein